ncbi:MAG TPA: NAD(P)-binding domain-containing protein [Phototrophicaceae bacterium]|nr:NAD(P)-binding domain-containing protein [Phototrophicaceae bacterium]
MTPKSLGFIGGGRITRIMLAAFAKAGQLPAQIIVSDANSEVLDKLKVEFPSIHTTADNLAPATQDMVFIALHPPAFGSLLSDLKPCLQPNAILVSLAPRVTLKKMAESLDGFTRLARLIPNAPSIIGQGYNPIAFAAGLPPADRADLLNLLSLLGECPEVDEDKLEAYAILTAMGPTYLWFQLYELQTIAQSFGLSAAEVQTGITKMVNGAVSTMMASGLSPEAVMDLVPVKPLADEESHIKAAYHQKLEALYTRLKG